MLHEIAQESLAAPLKISHLSIFLSTLFREPSAIAAAYTPDENLHIYGRQQSAFQCGSVFSSFFHFFSFF
jgi:hypothetical protein